MKLEAPWRNKQDRSLIYERQMGRSGITAKGAEVSAENMRLVRTGVFWERLPCPCPCHAETPGEFAHERHQCPCMWHAPHECDWDNPRAACWSCFPRDHDEAAAVL